MSSVIYCALNLVNGKQYIGKAAYGADHRKRHHIYVATGDLSDGVFHRAIRKYGVDAFEWSVLKEVDDPEDLDVWERYFISKLKTKLPSGYNMTDGGSGMLGYRHTEEAKDKISKAHKGRLAGLSHVQQFGAERAAEISKKMRVALTGKRRTIEQKKRLSDALTGRVFSVEHLVNMSLSQIGKNKGKTYEEMYGVQTAEVVKEKRRQAFIGNTNWLGRKHSEESKRKMSEVQQGSVKHSAAVKQKLSEKRKGKTLEEIVGVERAKEWRLRMSEAMRRRHAERRAAKNEKLAAD